MKDRSLFWFFQKPKSPLDYAKLTTEEREIFSFIPEYTSFINELRTILSCINSIEYEIKQNGLSLKSVKNCMKYIERDLVSENKRITRIREKSQTVLSTDCNVG